MEIVIIDNEAAKLCIDTNHPHHTKVKSAVEYHAAEINKLIQESVFESRIKIARENNVRVPVSAETVVICEGDICDGNFTRR
jgi:hypothetical protein